jgi:hypothetical protein
MKPRKTFTLEFSIFFGGFFGGLFFDEFSRFFQISGNFRITRGFLNHRNFSVVFQKIRWKNLQK